MKDRFKKIKGGLKKMIPSFIILGLITLNFLSYQNFQRFDLSQNKIYTLSESSIEIAQSLDDLVRVKVYFSNEIPPHLFRVKQYSLDILNEFSTYSDGRIFIENNNPDDERHKEEAILQGIKPVQMNVVEEDRLEVKKGFLGIAFQYGEAIETIPVIQSSKNLEYKIASALKKVSSKEAKKIGIIEGLSTKSFQKKTQLGTENESFSLLFEEIKQNYEVKIIEANNIPSPDKIETLILISPTEVIDQEIINSIKNYNQSGGNLVMLIDQYEIKNNLSYYENLSDLSEILDPYEIKISKDLVLDRKNEKTSFNQGLMSFILPYPFWIKLTEENLNLNHPITSSIKSLVYPWGNHLIINNENKATILMESSNAAWSEKYPFKLDPSQIQSSTKKNTYTLAAITKNKNNPSGNIFVMPNSKVVNNKFIQLYPENLNFIMNAIDHFNLDSSLIEIRSKSNSTNPILELTNKQKQLVRSIGIFLAPLAVILFGIIRFLNRRHYLNNLKWE